MRAIKFRVKWILFGLYLVALHLLIIFLLIKTDVVPRVVSKINQLAGIEGRYYDVDHANIILQRGVHQSIDPFTPRGATIFLGDSITWALATVDIEPLSVNYGITNQRSDQLLKSMESYESLKQAGRVVVTIGTNDLLQGREDGIEERYKKILDMIPKEIPVLMNSVPPIANIIWNGRKVNNANVQEVVASAKRICEADSRCTFLNTYEVLSENGKPLPGVLVEDGVHLSRNGYGLWIENIRNAIYRVHSQGG